MNNTAGDVPLRWGDLDLPSLDASDDFEELACPEVYCSAHLLDAFSLLMAGHGHCVSTAMMLGDREYAMWQLARARTTDNGELRAVADKLFGYLANAQVP